jgi:hypothetical protein
MTLANAYGDDSWKSDAPLGDTMQAHADVGEILPAPAHCRV